MDNAGALPTYPQRSSNQRDQINRTIDESRLSANNPIASGTGPGGDIMSESGGAIISVRRGDFIGIRTSGLPLSIFAAMIEEELAAARAAAEKTGRPARRFKDFQWSTLDTWSRRRRVVAKAEWTKGEANPRFVVTSLARSEAAARPAL